MSSVGRVSCRNLNVLYEQSASQIYSAMPVGNRHGDQWEDPVKEGKISGAELLKNLHL
jgi:hypothetical protein